jgi:hypothetical protein
MVAASVRFQVVAKASSTADIEARSRHSDILVEVIDQLGNESKPRLPPLAQAQFHKRSVRSASLGLPAGITHQFILCSFSNMLGKI